MIPNAKVLITGGAGSWGKELTQLLLATDVQEIVILSNGELHVVNMSREPLFSDKRITYVIGDIRDLETLREHFRDVDYVFHLAALKHVPVCEKQPVEAIKINVDGTINVVTAAIENKVKQVIYVSTDKAVDPINTYGMTKLLGEKVILQANANNHNTKFIVVRSGNVLGTNGSVIPLFKKLIAERNAITLTDEDMTRFFITIQEAIKLLLDASNFTVGGEIFVLKMHSFFMKDVASAVIEKYGNSDTKIIDIGLRPGEKIHELLISKHEAINTYHYNDKYFVILPATKIEQLSQHYDKLKLIPFGYKEYNSCDTWTSIEQLKALI